MFFKLGIRKYPFIVLASVTTLPFTVSILHVCLVLLWSHNGTLSTLGEVTSFTGYANSDIKLLTRTLFDLYFYFCWEET